MADTVGMAGTMGMVEASAGDEPMKETRVRRKIVRAGISTERLNSLTRELKKRLS